MTQFHEFVPQLRWSDQDLQGHINNARMTTILEEARIRWLIGRDGVGNIGRLKLVASQTIHYRRPVQWGPEFLLRLWISRVGNTSFTISYHGIQEGQVCIEASVVMVTVDEDNRPLQLLAPDKDFLNGYFHEDVPLP